jgi:hypothetical protein
VNLALASFLPPPDEDSKDLTDREISEAIPALSWKDVAKEIVETLRKVGSEFYVSGYEMRRRNGRLYWRTRLIAHGEPDIVLVFRADWLKPYE